MKAEARMESFMVLDMLGIVGCWVRWGLYYCGLLIWMVGTVEGWPALYIRVGEGRLG